MVSCECACGKIIEVQAQHLRTGNTSSCGCKKVELQNKARMKHGLSKTRIFNIWQGMKARCYNSKTVGYENYGGRGISVCSEWLNDFMCFYEWSINNGYSEELSIDRIDVNGNYEPSNCRWADDETQANNKRNNIIITHNGETMNLSQWAKKLDIPVHVLINRRNLGWSDERILEEPYHKGRKGYGCVNYEYNGEIHSLTEWAELYGMKFNCLYSRWKKGKRGKDLFYGYEILEQIGEV